VTVDDYFAAIERGLRQNVHIGRIEESITCLASDDYNGLIRCRVVFWDDSYLDTYEVVSTELGYPVRVHYAYTYVREGRRAFRYDNAPHHPEIVTHPHHKHIGPADRLAPADPPNLSQLLAEVETWLGS
jgi:ketosteroid isomerase-like protein